MQHKVIGLSGLRGAEHEASTAGIAHDTGFLSRPPASIMGSLQLQADAGRLPGAASDEGVRAPMLDSPRSISSTIVRLVGGLDKHFLLSF